MNITKILSYADQIIPNQQSSLSRKTLATIAIPLFVGQLAHGISFIITINLYNRDIIKYSTENAINEYAYNLAVVVSFIALAKRVVLFSSK